MFYFILHPLQWLAPEHATIIFKANRLEDGVYEVTWNDGTGTATSYYYFPDVMEALAKGWWIITDAQGEY